MTSQALLTYSQTLENLIDGWIFDKLNSKSGSKKTETAYRDTLSSFRETLQRGGLDLDSEDTRTISQVAMVWANVRKPGATRDGDVAPATYNQRLAIISSFYAFCKEQGIDCHNPIEDVKKRKVQAYAQAAPLDGDETAEALLSIDRTTLVGKRDYALLAIALQTGRRANELVGLRWQHVQITGKKGAQRVTLHFDSCKGGKKMRDALDADTAYVFLDYLHSLYGERLMSLEKDAPIWISFSRQNSGQPISIHTLKDICETYLGTGKLHALRHTFAAEMEKAGAPLSEIQHRLGHENITTTSIYLRAVRSADNPYASRLSARFGIGKEKRGN
jgi:integrase